MTAAVMLFPPLDGKETEEYCDQTDIQEEDTLHVEKAPVRSFLAHNTSRGRIEMLSEILHIHCF